ncbi:MAG: hypothetical protein RMJ19_00555 [Gemmatales bacterium]|nr:hypothetical protein [Gemmatales bacterium]MDW8174134.1 hypothetical protein [Gemmatales bacterium]
MTATLRLPAWFHSGVLVLLWGWWASAGEVQAEGRSLPSLVNAPVALPLRLSRPPYEPVRAGWLTLASEPRVPVAPPRAVPHVRGLSVPIAPQWSPLQPAPQRPSLPAGPKAYAAKTDTSVPLHSPWLRLQPVPASGTSEAWQAVYLQSVLRTSAPLREQAVIGEAGPNPDLIGPGRPARNLEVPAESVVWLVLRGRPPIPPLPVSSAAK